MTWALWVALGGAAGALVRHAASVRLRSPGRPVSPRGTTLVNLTGAFLAGLLAGVFDDAPRDAAVFLLLALGFLGALTTFSTWMLEVIDLAENRGRGSPTPLFHLVGLLAAGILLAWIGLVLGS